MQGLHREFSAAPLLFKCSLLSTPTLVVEWYLFQRCTLYNILITNHQKQIGHTVRYSTVSQLEKKMSAITSLPINNNFISGTDRTVMKKKWWVSEELHLSEWKSLWATWTKNEERFTKIVLIQVRTRRDWFPVLYNIANSWNTDVQQYIVC